MDPLKWSESYSVGHSDIDQQHKQLFDVFSRLVQGIESGGPSFYAEQTFTQLYDYVTHHFKFEESLMEKFAYPKLDKHKKKHSKIKDKLKKYRKNFKKKTGKKKDAIASEVAIFLNKWLQDHIKKDDQKYVPYISQSNPKEGRAIAFETGM